jgi:hypothetical protein
LKNDTEVPELEDDMVLVRNAAIAIAINPVDAKMVGPLATEGAVAATISLGPSLP